MDESWWEMHYDRISGPSAKAYRLLEKIELGPDLDRRGDGPHLQFREGGGNQSIIRPTHMRATCSRCLSSRHD